MILKFFVQIFNNYDENIDEYDGITTTAYSTTTTTSTSTTSSLAKIILALKSDGDNRLVVDRWLYSENGMYAFGLSDKKWQIYKKDKNSKWQKDYYINLVNIYNDRYALKISSKGHLELIDDDDDTVWNSKDLNLYSSNNIKPPCTLKLENDGRLVVTDSKNYQYLIFSKGK